jgi:hypothetical protein
MINRTSRAITAAASAAVVAVAATAAVVSFGHIETLALSHGQPLPASRLLPVSVDGLLTAASLVLLDAARSGRKAPTFARYMLALGVLATVAANLAYGWHFGPVGMAVSAWPAVAFIGSAETLTGMIRQGRASVVEPVAPTVAEASPSPSAPASPKPVRVAEPRIAGDTAAALLDALAAKPGASVASVARSVGMHPRTAQRVVARQRLATA